MAQGQPLRDAYRRAGTGLRRHLSEWGPQPAATDDARIARQRVKKCDIGTRRRRHAAGATRPGGRLVRWRRVRDAYGAQLGSLRGPRRRRGAGFARARGAGAWVGAEV